MLGFKGKTAINYPTSTTVLPDATKDWETKSRLRSTRSRPRPSNKPTAPIDDDTDHIVHHSTLSSP